MNSSIISWKTFGKLIGVVILFVGCFTLLFQRLATSADLTGYLATGHYEQWNPAIEYRNNMISIMLGERNERIISATIFEKCDSLFGEEWQVYWMSQYRSLYEILETYTASGRGFQVVGVVKGGIFDEYVILKVDIKLSDSRLISDSPGKYPFRSEYIDSMSRGATWDRVYSFESMTYSYLANMSVHVHIAAIKSTMWGEKIQECNYIQDSLVVNVMSVAKITVPDDAVIDSIARNDPFRKGPFLELTH